MAQLDLAKEYRDLSLIFEKVRRHVALNEKFDGADTRTRTANLLFTKQLHYRLCYVGNVL